MSNFSRDISIEELPFYVTKINHGEDKSIVFFAAFHIQNANSKFKSDNISRQKFALEHTVNEAAPDWILLEGRPQLNKQNEGNPDFQERLAQINCCKKIDEGVIAVQKAAKLQKECKVYSPEPLDQEGHDHLLTLYSKEDIFAYYVLSVLEAAIKQFSKEKNKMPKTTQEIQVFMNEQRFGIWKINRLGENKYTVDDAFKKGHELFGEKFKPTDPKFANDLYNPNLDLSVFNQIAKAATSLRNQELISQIEDGLKEVKTILIIYGKGHEEDVMSCLESKYRTKKQFVTHEFMPKNLNP